MKVATYNTQHCLNYQTGKIDFEAMAEAILSLDADVVGLNEMRGEGPDKDYTAQVEKLAELCGMKYYYFAKAIDLKYGPYGNGLISRIPIKNAKTVPIPDPVVKKYNDYYETRCLLVCELEGGVRVMVTHFGLNPDEAENAVKCALENITDKRCILMGDFNLKPESEILAPIFDKMQDAAEGFCAEKMSFPADAPNRKIDYIFTSRDAKIFGADIPENLTSDHRPHTAMIEFGENAK